MIKKYKIKDLDCANCAIKIENAYSNLKGVSSAKVDFAREKVIIEGDVSSYTAKDLEKIAQSIERQVKVTEEEHHDHEGEQTNRQEIILN
ncbi:MAG TPA: heavy metal translocating P-type ATPase, partial [Acholeplasmataceae bacterium]|nr:heavy metal translocating P-type ATPase [Acholeplasmataceae bacterium]